MLGVKIVKGMKKSKKERKAKLNKQERVLYGQKTQYWPDEFLPFLVASACVEVVLKNSEEASLIYHEAKEAWGRQDCRNALNGVKIPFSSMLGAIDAVVSNKIADYSNPLAGIIEQHKDSADFKYLISRVNDFIKVGFNSETDQAKARYKVKPSSENWLFYAVFIGILVDFSAERKDWDTYKLLEFGGQVYDPTTFMDAEHSNRKYRRKVSYYRSFGWRLRQDDKLKNMAWYWYQSRVVYSGPEEFCRKYLIEKGIELEPANVSKEILLCDMATGYPRKNLTE